MLEALSHLKVVSIGQVDDRSVGAVVERLLGAFDGSIRSHEVIRRSKFLREGEIDADFLAAILATEIGGHVLGVTDLDLKYADDEYIFGGKDVNTKVAVVSTKRLVPYASMRYEQERLTSRVAKVAIHEVGHQFWVESSLQIQKISRWRLLPND